MATGPLHTAAGVADMTDDIFFKSIREDIFKAMEYQSRPALRFVTKHHLGGVWTTPRLENFCRVARLEGMIKPTEMIEYLRKNLLRTLSILVYIHWEYWDKFHRIFFDHVIAPPLARVDRSMKEYGQAELEREDFLGDSMLANAFLDFRDQFFPIVIKEGMVKVYREGRRLPFMELQNGVVELGEGGYGKVRKEIIAIMQYRRDTGRQVEICPVARKVLVQKEDFQKETENLEYLKRSLLKHDRIATFLAIISVETGLSTEFNILSELADMNLQEFLDGRHNEFTVTPQSLMSECAHLADALRFLHKGIEIPRDAISDAGSQEGPMTCHHMDLKPENILLYKHPRYPVCIWKISDFGISRIKESVSRQPKGKQRNDKSLLEVPRMLGELKRSMNSQKGQTSRTNAKRNSGTWQAPEVHQSPEKVVGIESDVWSFGCILVSIVALALGPNELASLETTRGKTKQGIHYDYVNDDRFYRTRDGVMELNPHIESWVDFLPQRQGHNTDITTFLLNSRDILFSTLKIKPEDRINSGNLHLALKRIFYAPSNGADRAVSATNKSTQSSEPAPVPSLKKLEASSAHIAVNPELIDGESGSHTETQLQSNSQITTESPNSHPSLDQRAEIQEDTISQDQTPTLISQGKGRETLHTPVMEADASKVYLHADMPTPASEGRESPLFGTPRISIQDRSQDTGVSGPSNLRERTNVSIPDRHIDRIGTLPLESNCTLFGGVGKKRSLAKRPTFPSEKVAGIGSSKKDFAPEHDVPPNAVVTNGYHPNLSNGCASKGTPGTLALESHSASATPRSRSIPPKTAKSTPSVTKSPPNWLPTSEMARIRPQFPHSRVNSLRSEAHQSTHTSSSSGISSFTGQLGPATFQLHPPNVKNVTRTIISSDCTWVAFLSSTNIYLYAIRGEEHPRLELPRPDGWKWISVSISGDFILAVGQVAKGGTVFRKYEIIADAENDASFEIEPADGSRESSVEGGVISCKGYVLYQQQSAVLLAHMEFSEFAYVRAIDLCCSPEIDIRPQLLPTEGKVRRSWFNESGTWAYAWSVKQANHYIKAWNVSNPDISRQIIHPIPEHQNHGDPVRAVLSFPKSVGFVLWKSHNNILIAPHNCTDRWGQNLSKLDDLQALAITPSEDHIVYIRVKWKFFAARKTKLYIRRMEVDRDGNVVLLPPRKVLLNHLFQHGSSTLSVASDKRDVRCFVVHITGDVEKVVFDAHALLDTSGL
ncbi:uncharacterized protein PAC_01357 [Phialocephala subalpina]|uniref:Protein kinase domain-containing protein n=1 Tax=Phialocephala subalpina TaxID=576137 RepID=A0A1L7WFD4_9HELO|nr:uncharacterized protein PAC_01357 [Phialocephala subalpina]